MYTAGGDTMEDTVGFVGLGSMGGHMAHNISRAGFSLWVYDARQEALTSFANGAARCAENLTQIAENCNRIVLSLPDGNVVKDALYGESGLRGALRAGQIIVDCSTTSPDYTAEAAAELEQAEVVFLDAPVTGMEARAEDGTLTIMVGGDESAFASVRPILEAMGTVVVHMGPSGCGQLMKATNNVLYNISIAAMAEMLPFAVRLGLDPEKVRQVVSTGSGQSFGFDFFSKRALEREFGKEYPMGRAFKDFVTVMGKASVLQVPIPVASASMQTYLMALSEGLGEESKGAMIKVWEKVNGVEISSQ